MALLKPFRKAVAKMRGNAARLTAYLPVPIQTHLAHAMGYRHAYEGLDSHVRFLLAIRGLEGDGRVFGEDILKSRRHFHNEMAAIVGKPTQIAKVRNFTISSENNILPVRHYQPDNGEGTPLLVFYHGGGFVVGNLDTHDEACRLLCKYGQMQVLSVDYRLAPEYPAPAAVDDCIAALKWAHAHSAELGVDPKKITVGGDSAGGNLATVVSQQTKGTPDAPAAQLLIYPVVDLVNEYESRKAFTQGLFLSDLDIEQANAAYVGLSELTLQDPLVTPALGDMTNLAPALVITAAFDVLRDEAEAYAKRMQELGNKVLLERVKDHGHGFINITPINRSAKNATIKMAKDFRVFLDSL